MAPATRGEEPATRDQEKVPGVKMYKYRAVVTLSGSVPYPNGTHAVMVGCCHREKPTQHRYFPAAIYRSDEQPLTPGDSSVVVTLEIADDEASAYFSPGQQVTLWHGRDIGHGVISRRVFFTSVP
jgi:hypothetical protein